jgi:predicted kinase
MFGTSVLPAGYGEAHYQPDMRSRVYDELFRQASETLDTDQSVILDGTFLTCDLRDRAYDLADRHAAISLHIQCTCARQTAYARIQERAETGQSESEARTELYDRQARDIEPPPADELFVMVDTTQSMSHQLHLVYAELRRLLFS